MAKAATIAVRVLVDTPEHKINDVVELTAAEAKTAVDGGWADDHPEAVAYARSLAEAPADEDEAFSA